MKKRIVFPDNRKKFESYRQAYNLPKDFKSDIQLTTQQRDATLRAKI